MKSGKLITRNDTITIGSAGRLVIPKPLRERLGLREGGRLRVEVSAGVLQLEPLPDEMKIDEEDGFPVIRGGAARGKGRVVDAIKAEREARDERIARRK
jgi:AbrB family looped-hinge helix DNA binding protein